MRISLATAASAGVRPGGEVYERELLKDLGAGRGVRGAARGRKPHPERVAGLVVHPVWPPKGLRWYVTSIRVAALPSSGGGMRSRRPAARALRGLRGPAALWARGATASSALVTHHHHWIRAAQSVSSGRARRLRTVSSPTASSRDASCRRSGLGTTTCGWCTAGSGRSSAPVATPRARCGYPAVATAHRATSSWRPSPRSSGPSAAAPCSCGSAAAAAGRRRGAGAGAGRRRRRRPDRLSAEADKIPMPEPGRRLRLLPRARGLLAGAAGGMCAQAGRRVHGASLPEMVEDGGSGFLVARNDRAAFVDRVVCPSATSRCARASAPPPASG